jgi:hypothetical protein
MGHHQRPSVGEDEARYVPRWCGGGYVQVGRLNIDALRPLRPVVRPALMAWSFELLLEPHCLRLCRPHRQLGSSRQIYMLGLFGRLVVRRVGLSCRTACSIVAASKTVSKKRAPNRALWSRVGGQALVARYALPRIFGRLIIHRVVLPRRTDCSRLVGAVGEGWPWPGLCGRFGGWPVEEAMRMLAEGVWAAA